MGVSKVLLGLAHLTSLLAAAVMSHEGACLRDGRHKATPSPERHLKQCSLYMESVCTLHSRLTHTQSRPVHLVSHFKQPSRIGPPWIVVLSQFVNVCVSVQTRVVQRRMSRICPALCPAWTTLTGISVGSSALCKHLLIIINVY